MLMASAAVEAQTLYNFGNPTPDEQLYFELINRARANPPAEGLRLATLTDTDIITAYQNFGVDLTMMRTEHNAIPAAPPIAPNAILMGVARAHSNWMYNNGVQDHFENGVSPSARVTAAGYTWGAMGENIFVNAVTPSYGHASFIVDWGVGSSGTSGGMQLPRGHRTRTYNANYREAGIGIVYGTRGSVGPASVTQDFATQQGTPTFATGVAYYDLDGDGAYDAGEGIPGLRVDVSGASYYCQTAAGGGWVVIVPSAAATRTVSFSGNGLNQMVPVTIPQNTNAKADLALPYAGPVITSPATAYVNNVHALTFNAVPGASSYRWKRWTTSPADDDNAESLLGAVLSLLGAQPTLNLLVKAQGLTSYQIVNNGEYGVRFIEMGALYRGTADSAMDFQSRVAYSTTAERFKVQVKEEGTATWRDVDVQTGANGAGQAGFAQRNVPLSSMAGKNFRLRFALTYASGAYYPPNLLTTRGWFIDAIHFDDVLQLENETSTTLATNSGSFTPGAAGTLVHAVQPVISGTEFPAASQVLTISTGQPPPSFQSWASRLESLNSLPPGTLSTAAGDPDGDGRANLLEYAFGTSPVSAADSTTRWPVASRSGGQLVLDYQRDTSLVDLTYTVEASTDLSVWRAPGQPGAPAGFTDQPVVTNGSLQSRRASIPLSSGQQMFVRVRVTKAP